MRSVPVRRKRRKAAKRARYNRAMDRRMSAEFAKRWPTVDVSFVPRPIVQDIIQLVWGNDAY